MAGRSRKRSRSAIALTASILVHLVLVGVVMVSLPRTGPPPEPRSFEVTLVLPRPPSPARPRRTAAVSAGSAAARPSVPSEIPPPVQAPAAQAPPSGEDQEGLARMRGVLRGSVGCSEAGFAHLSRQELDGCARWRQANLHPDRAIPAPIAPEKRAWFEASLAARGSMSHPPGFVCGMLIDGLKLVKPKAPPHALQLGSLPCYVIPPKWTFTEEADVETPSKQASEHKALDYTPSAFIGSDKGLAPGGGP
jgi:hypothetical protein